MRGSRPALTDVERLDAGTALKGHDLGYACLIALSLTVRLFQVLSAPKHRGWM